MSHVIFLFGVFHHEMLIKYIYITKLIKYFSICDMRTVALEPLYRSSFKPEKHFPIDTQ